MEETIGCKTVQQLETFLQEEYHAQPVEPVDYLLYNARQQMLNLFYPQQMQQLAEQIGFGPESDEEVCALFDCLTETFDRETAGSRYVQYRFTQTLPEGVQAVFYVTVERVTGFVLPQFEWASEGNGEGVGESFLEGFPDVSEQSYRLLNQTMRSIVLYQGVSEQDILQNTPRYQRYETAHEFCNSVC